MKKIVLGLILFLFLGNFSFAGEKDFICNSDNIGQINFKGEECKSILYNGNNGDLICKIALIYSRKDGKFSKAEKDIHKIGFESSATNIESDLQCGWDNQKYGKLNGYGYQWVISWKTYYYFDKKEVVENIENKILIYKNNLLNSKFEKYLPRIDKLVEKTNLEKLKNINLKLEKIDSENKKYSKIKVLIEYLRAKIKLEIYERENN